MSPFASVRASQPRDISPFVCPKKAAEYLAVSLRYLEQLRAGRGPSLSSALPPDQLSKG